MNVNLKNLYKYMANAQYPIIERSDETTEVIIFYTDRGGIIIQLIRYESLNTRIREWWLPPIKIAPSPLHGVL